MNKFILISSLSVLLAACGSSDEVQKTVENSASDGTNKAVEVVDKAKEAAKSVAGTDEKTAAVNEAKMITKSFAESLKKELQTAMKAGGPINGLDVCSTKAIPITESSAKEHGASVSRVSLKNRNPLNVPNDWQKAVLENFDARAAKGEDVVKMGFSEVVENDGKKQLRFMKALPTGSVCLNCHGSNIKPEVQAKITELYPEDKATGYQEGQVRGAIVVLKTLK